MSKKDIPMKEIPEILCDDNSGKRYTRGRFLGKGGFAKCFEITDHETKETLAGKIVPKALLVKPHQKEKMTQEISLHRSLNHDHVVGFHGFFEDKDFVYIVLELCKRRSLMELYKRRKALTEPETKYYMKQILLGVVYLHDKKIIHRDIKLGNLFLNNEMEVKIGDFGLATKVDFEGERKKTLCGTPNYIAPEVLGKKGHSFEVDTWSLGCVLYTLLVGKPPFETSTLKETYSRIKKNEYRIPHHVSPAAKTLIKRMLCNEPSSRPSAKEALESDFFNGYIPHKLPTTCLTMAPRFPEMQTQSQRKPLQDINGSDNTPAQMAGKKSEPNEICNNESPDFHMGELFEQLTKLIDSNPSHRNPVNMDEAEDPAANPVLWISKWVDYTDKYGLGYQLCDNSNGVLFNDSTRILLYANGEHIEYIDKDMSESYYTIRTYPDMLVKKVTLLKYFRNYMSEHLLKAGASMAPKEGDQLARLPFLRTWFRTRSAIVLHLSNGTLQINFFADHTKIILCPLMGAVTYIDDNRKFRTYRLSSLEKYGCCKELAHRLRYARTMLEKLKTSRASTARIKDQS
ncbi:serine/threonine-protein kinase PLK1-like [Styela clava]|uniref:serine/threonine-protein kinase PLK1-like n=1 Tax=Styela clava TaxID=7725 RepID=UPI00193A1230|nr:serine/threonine-protein kinase PLK1-like [Styela clava]